MGNIFHYFVIIFYFRTTFSSLFERKCRYLHCILRPNSNFVLEFILFIFGSWKPKAKLGQRGAQCTAWERVFGSCWALGGRGWGVERGETDVYPTVCTKYNKKYSQGGSKCICTVVGPQQASGPGAAAHAAAAMKIKIPSCSLQLVSLQCNPQSLLPCRSVFWCILHCKILPYYASHRDLLVSIAQEHRAGKILYFAVQMVPG